MSVERFDALVIGAGQGGGPLATAFAAAGRRTAIIERAWPGGTCVNVGCTPTKTMVASARVAHLARRAAEYGVDTGPVTVDMDRVRSRKRAIVEQFRAASRRRLAAAPNLEYVEGDATFTGPRTLSVAVAGAGRRTLGADIVALDVGARPAPLAIPGLEGWTLLDSTSIMELDRLPRRLVVLGGGYVGLEFAQMFRRFGAEVTVVHRGSHLLSREDDDIAGCVAGILREDGIDLRLETRVACGRVTAEGAVLELTGAGAGEVCASHVLAAAGRVANTDTLGLDEAGVAHRHGFIEVDERLATSADGVYAIGDCKAGPQFTHISYDDYRILRTNLIEGGTATTRGRLVPYTVFTDPQLGRVGLTEREAREQSDDVRAFTLPMSHVARALEVAEPRGMMKAVVDGPTGRILGVAVLGLEGGEVMAALQLAMMGGIGAAALRDGIFAHPTLAESFNNLFASV